MGLLWCNLVPVAGLFLTMLRGKFGQIGSKLGDGHIVMDAFQQVRERYSIGTRRNRCVALTLRTSMQKVFFLFFSLEKHQFVGALPRRVLEHIGNGHRETLVPTCVSETHQAVVYSSRSSPEAIKLKTM